MSSTILYHMNRFGRISVCGSIAAYNATEIPKGKLPKEKEICILILTNTFSCNCSTGFCNKGIGNERIFGDNNGTPSNGRDQPKP